MSCQIVECHNCGTHGPVGGVCIKCETQLKRIFSRPLHIIDIAHNGEDREDAYRKVIEGIESSLSRNHKGLKVIHGHGSRSGHSAVIRNYIVPLLKKEAKRFKARLVKDKDNPGAHILYFN